MEISCTRWEAHVHWFPITVVVTHTLSVTPDLFVVPQRALSVCNRKEDVECEAVWLEEDGFFSTKLLQRIIPPRLRQKEALCIFFWFKNEMRQILEFQKRACFLSYFFESAKLTTEYFVWIVCVLKLRRTNSKHETRILVLKVQMGRNQNIRGNKELRSICWVRAAVLTFLSTVVADSCL